VAELIGTFALVLTVGCAALSRDDVMAPIAAGGVLAAAVYAGSHISGAHYNPAVSLAAYIRGAIPGRDLAPYWLAQLCGATLAALAARFITDTYGHAVTPPGRELGSIFVAELLFTFLLAFVVLSVATGPDVPNNYFGLAIGATLTAGALAVGPLTGGLFNPAVLVGTWILGLVAPGSVWVYALATFTGGAAAGGVFLALELGRPEGPVRTGHVVDPATHIVELHSRPLPETEESA
jgi:aquaporin Z